MRLAKRESEAHVVPTKAPVSPRLASRHSERTRGEGGAGGSHHDVVLHHGLDVVHLPPRSASVIWRAPFSTRPAAGGGPRRTRALQRRSAGRGKERREAGGARDWLGLAAAERLRRGLAARRQAGWMPPGDRRQAATTQPRRHAMATTPATRHWVAPARALWLRARSTRICLPAGAASSPSSQLPV